MKHDASFSEASAYGSKRWIAARLGKSVDWLHRNRALLADEGFPREDAIFGMVLKEDVDAWIAKRRTIVDPAQKPAGARLEAF